MTSANLPSPALFRLVTVAAFASSISMRICDPMLPALAREFSVGLSAVAPVIGLFAIAYGLMQLVYGPLGERFGLFRLTAWATLLAGLASLLCAATSQLELLMLGRMLTGATAAGIVPLLFAWIGERVPYALRQVSIARVAGGVALGAVAGQALGGIMVDTLGWRWAFGVQAVLLLAPASLMLHLTYRIDNSSTADLKAPTPLSLITSWRGYSALLADAWVRRLLLTVGLEGFLFFSALALLPSALHDRFDIALWHAGLVTALYGLGGFSYTAVAPWLLGRLGEIKLVRLGWIGSSLCLLALTVAPNWMFAALILLILGLCFYCQHNTLQTHGTQMAPLRRGFAMACFACVYFVGQALGVAIASSIVQRIGFSMLFTLVAVALALLGVSLEAALRQKQGGEHALGRTTREL